MRELGDGWSSAANRNLKSFAEIGKFGPWIALCSEREACGQLPHLVRVDGQMPNGNLLISDPLEGTKFEINAKHFYEDVWTQRALYRIRAK